MSETPKVYAAINAVQAVLAKEGITKSRKNQQQGYAFRGIDEIYNTISPLLAQHHLCIVPRIISRECVERPSKSGGVLFNVVVQAQFDFISSDDGSIHTVQTWGEAMDSADKATNKAMSAAYKYATLMTFAIPTEGDNDADAHTPEPVPKAEAPKPQPPAMVTKEQLVEIRKLLKSRGKDEQKAAMAVSGNECSEIDNLKRNEAEALIARLLKMPELQPA